MKTPKKLLMNSMVMNSKDAPLLSMKPALKSLARVDSESTAAVVVVVVVVVGEIGREHGVAVEEDIKSGKILDLEPGD